MQRLSSCVLFGLLLASPAVARAEAGVVADCYARTSPSYGETVPANLPAFVVTTDGVGKATLLSATVDGPAPPTLTAQMDPRSDATLYLLDRELEPTAMVGLDVQLNCENVPSPGVRTRTTDFKTSAATPIPTATGSLKVGRIDGQWTVAELTPSPELASYLPVTMFDVSIDGKVQGQVPYGYWKLQNGVLAISLGRYGVGGLTTGQALCGAGETGMKVANLGIRPHVAGAMTDPPWATLAAPIDCSSKPVDPAPPQKSGGAGASGCSLAASQTQSAGTLFALAFAFGLLALRRRRRVNGSNGWST